MLHVPCTMGYDRIYSIVEKIGGKNRTQPKERPRLARELLLSRPSWLTFCLVFGLRAIGNDDGDENVMRENTFMKLTIEQANQISWIVYYFSLWHWLLYYPQLHLIRCNGCIGGAQFSLSLSVGVFKYHLKLTWSLWLRAECNRHINNNEHWKINSQKCIVFRAFISISVGYCQLVASPNRLVST